MNEENYHISEETPLDNLTVFLKDHIGIPVTPVTEYLKLYENTLNETEQQQLLEKINKFGEYPCVTGMLQINTDSNAQQDLWPKDNCFMVISHIQTKKKTKVSIQLFGKRRKLNTLTAENLTAALKLLISL
jgi:hypothetical protein